MMAVSNYFWTSRLPKSRKHLLVLTVLPKILVPLAMTNAMRSTTLDQPQASRGPKSCFLQLYLQQAAAAGDNVPWQTL